MELTAQSFPKQLRLRKTAEFRHVYDQKRSASDGFIVVYIADNGLSVSRLGCSVSKKVGNAPTRNKWKRSFREAFRTVRLELPTGLDIVLIPRSQDGFPSLEQLQTSLKKLLPQAQCRTARQP